MVDDVPSLIIVPHAFLFCIDHAGIVVWSVISKTNQKCCEPVKKVGPTNPASLLRSVFVLQWFETAMPTPTLMPNDRLLFSFTFLFKL
jgi:hypothetical protein